MFYHMEVSVTTENQSGYTIYSVCAPVVADTDDKSCSRGLQRRK